VVRLRIFASLLAALFALSAAAARAPDVQRATGRIAVSDWPYMPGSTIPLRIDGFSPPFQAVLLGAGRIAPGGLYEIPADAGVGKALIVAGNEDGLAATTLHIAHPPPAKDGLIVVASYDDGIIFHRARNYAVLGVLATGGTPGDVAVDRFGKIAVPDTEGSALTLAGLEPWSVGRVDGVVLGDEVAIDSTTRAVFVTDRDVNGDGALTRISVDRSLARVTTGATAEGLAVDERHQLVYVANANDGTVAEVDARSMRLVRKFHVVSRVFSLALSSDGSVLYAISNESAGSLFGAPGSAVALELKTPTPRVIARSSNLAFPIGVALDSSTQTLFVTDESTDQIDVLDALSLHAKRPPLPTCSTPWKPALDEVSGRLYVPCAGANEIDAFDARTLHRVANAPFATGSYPLAVAVWHPK
jgi:DNA-binding beta-propeller fold protein YncE